MKIYTINYFFRNQEDKIIPFSYRNDLKYFFHKKIMNGSDKYHNDTPSLYSFSGLFNKKINVTKEGIDYGDYAIWKLRTPSKEIFREIYKNSQKCIGLELGYGYKLENINFKRENVTGVRDIEHTSSIIYLGQNPDSDEPDHILLPSHGEDVFVSHIKRIFLTKTKLLGYDFKEDDFELSVVNKNNSKTKAMLINGSHSICSHNVKFRIKSENTDIFPLFYSLGIGKSTGCGLGFMYDLNN